MLRRGLSGIALVTVGVVVGIALHLAIATGDTMFAGKRPDFLGVKDGKLQPTKRARNIVSSQPEPADAEHSIAPIRFKGSAVEAMAAVRKAVESSERAT